MVDNVLLLVAYPPYILVASMVVLDGTARQASDQWNLFALRENLLAPDYRIWLLSSPAKSSDLIFSGQVMIVMTSSNTFSENTTTLAFSTLQPSQLTSLAQGTFDTGSSPQTLTVIHPIPQNSESSGQTTYLATQGQGAGSILTVLQPSISHGGDAEVIGVVTEDGQLQTTDGTPVQTTGLSG